MTSPPTELAHGLWLFQTGLWQTNSLLLRRSAGALVCDPCWTPEEIARIRRKAGSGPLQLLLTHADYDHTCGIGFFPEATVLASPETAAAVESGAAADSLAAASREWGLEWPLDLRVDRQVAAGERFTCGAFEVEAIDARGHVPDGLAYAILDEGVLLPGDYLSSITYPFATWSVEAARHTCARLLAALDRLEPEWVVPGHGPALGAMEARRIGEADIEYLTTLEAVARDAVARGLSSGDALLAAYSVEPPRSTTDDFEVYGIRAFNARKALEQAGGDA